MLQLVRYMDRTYTKGNEANWKMKHHLVNAKSSFETGY